MLFLDIVVVADMTTTYETALKFLRKELQGLLSATGDFDRLHEIHLQEIDLQEIHLPKSTYGEIDLPRNSPTEIHLQEIDLREIDLPKSTYGKLTY